MTIGEEDSNKTNVERKRRSCRIGKGSEINESSESDPTGSKDLERGEGGSGKKKEEKLCLRDDKHEDGKEEKKNHKRTTSKSHDYAFMNPDQFHIISFLSQLNDYPEEKVNSCKVFEKTYFSTKQKYSISCIKILLWVF